MSSYPFTWVYLTEPMEEAFATQRLREEDNYVFTALPVFPGRSQATTSRSQMIDRLRSFSRLLEKWMVAPEKF